MPFLLPALMLPLLASATANLEGKVVDPQGKPLPGLALTVMIGNAEKTATTGKDGRFKIAGLPRGDGLLTFETDNWMPKTSEVTVPSSNLVVEALKLRRRRLTVKDEAGHPIDEVMVTVRASGMGRGSISLHTDEHGLCETSGVEASLDFALMKDGFVSTSVRSGEDEIEVTLRRAARLRVRTEGERALVNVLKIATVNGEEKVYGWDSASQPMQPRRVNANVVSYDSAPGAPYELDTLAPGSYLIAVWTPQGSAVKQISLPPDGLIVDVPVNARHPVEVKLRAKGKVEPETSISLTPVKDVLSERIPGWDVFHAWEDPSYEADAQVRAPTLKDALSLFQSAPMKTWADAGVDGVVHLDAPEGEYVRLVSGGSYLPVAAQRISVKASSLAPIDLVPRPRVSGKLVDADGRALRVKASLEETLQPGTFAVPLMPDRAPFQLLQFRLEDGAIYRLRVPTAASLALGEVKVPRLSNISGKVVDERGKPVAGAAVKLAQGWELTPHAWADTDYQGGLLLLPGETTARDGSFSLPDVRLDDAVVVVDVAGYAPAVVKAGNAPLTVQLTRGASLRGSVTDEHGKPLAGVTVGALPPFDVESSPLSPRKAITDAKGRFELTGLSEGPVSLRVHQREAAGRLDPRFSALNVVVGKEPLTVKLTPRMGTGSVELKITLPDTRFRTAAAPAIPHLFEGDVQPPKSPGALEALFERGISATVKDEKSSGLGFMAPEATEFSFGRLAPGRYTLLVRYTLSSGSYLHWQRVDVEEGKVAQVTSKVAPEVELAASVE